MTRRELLQRTSLLTALLNTNFFENYAMARKPIRISACDWSLGKSADVASLIVAREIGLEGVQISLGSEADNFRLRQKEIQTLFMDASKMEGVKLSSLAIGELNDIPYKSDPRTEQWVADSIDVARSIGVQVILLAFFYKGDLRNDPEGKKEVIRRLKIVAPKAEKLGVVLGIESYLSAEELMEIIQAVGSPAVKVYYDFRNSADAGYDVIKEIKWLGKDMICELHMKENGFLLGAGTLDWQNICDTLMAMNYYGSGWMQIEWAKPKEADLIESYKHNLNFLREKFKRT